MGFGCEREYYIALIVVRLKNGLIEGLFNRVIT